MNEKDLFIKNIDEDIKENGWRKWLFYSRYLEKNRDELDEEDIKDLREKIEYYYKKEEQHNITPQVKD